MRINTERHFRGGHCKGRNFFEASSVSSPSKSSKLLNKQTRIENILDNCSRATLPRQWSRRNRCVKASLLLASSVLVLFMLACRTDWLPILYSDKEILQLIPPVLQIPEPISLRRSEEGGIRNDVTSLEMPLRSFLNVGKERSHKRPPKELRKEYRWDDGVMAGDNPLGLSRSIKIFVYDLPARFNEDWLADSRCSNHLFAAEVAIHQRLLDSPVRTLKPSEADFFFVPVYVSCNFSTSNGFPSLGHARSLLRSSVQLVSRDMPYWNRSNGRDHIFVATHDYGACFHTMEDAAVAAGIPSFLQKSIILQTFGKANRHACQPDAYIQIPPFVPPIDPEWHPEMQKRDIWAYFRGKIELHPKNVSGRIYSRGIRTAIWRKFGHNRRFFIKRSRSPDYRFEISRSIFCLCPLGWAPWSPRIVESIMFGCVPVIIADKIALPYSHVIDWPRISITVPEKDVGKLGKILDKVSRTNLSRIQHTLWNSEYRKALSYMDPLTKGDAAWQILELLSKKRLSTNRPNMLAEV